MRSPVPIQDAEQKPDPVETMVKVTRLLLELDEVDQERVYMAVGQFVGVHMTINQHIAEQLEELVDLFKSSGVLGVVRR